MVSDGSTLVIGAGGRFDRRFLDSAAAAGFRVLLLEVDVDAESLYQRSVSRVGKLHMWRHILAFGVARRGAPIEVRPSRPLTSGAERRSPVEAVQGRGNSGHLANLGKSKALASD